MFLSVNKEYHSIFQAFQICENLEKHKRMADVTATIYFKEKSRKDWVFYKLPNLDIVPLGNIIEISLIIPCEFQSLIQNILLIYYLSLVSECYPY